MTDTLKALKDDAAKKKLIAENLRAQTRAAYAAAVRAQTAYAAEERHPNAGNKNKSTNLAYAANIGDATHSHSNPVSSPEDYHRDKIAQSEAIITNLEYELSEERYRLFTYKQNLHECQNGEDLSSIVERDRSAEFWLEQLQTKYRHHHSTEVAIILNKAGISSLDLCYLVVDMAEIIKSETAENLKVIDIMKNWNGLLTTPGNVKDSIYYHICKSQVIDLSTNEKHLSVKGLAAQQPDKYKPTSKGSIQTEAGGLTFTFPAGTTVGQIGECIDGYFAEHPEDKPSSEPSVLGEAVKGELLAAAKVADIIPDTGNSVLSGLSWVGHKLGIGDGTYTPAEKVSNLLPDSWIPQTKYVRTGADIISDVAGFELGGAPIEAAKGATWAERLQTALAKSATGSVVSQETKGNVTANRTTQDEAIQLITHGAGEGLRALLADRVTLCSPL